jgi:hypothetical protein
MKTPLQCGHELVGYEYHWYRSDKDTQGFSFDGAEKVDQHWLPRDVFDKLTGGELSYAMGIRRYSSQEAALADLRRASK